jgi:hypothetical protein
MFGHMTNTNHNTNHDKNHMYKARTSSLVWVGAGEDDRTEDDNVIERALGVLSDAGITFEVVAAPFERAA